MCTHTHPHTHIYTYVYTHTHTHTHAHKVRTIFTQVITAFILLAFLLPPAITKQLRVWKILYLN